MENKAEFIAYKKLLIFGAEQSGKSNFVRKLETNSFPVEYSPSEDGILLYLTFNRYLHNSPYI